MLGLRMLYLSGFGLHLYRITPANPILRVSEAEISHVLHRSLMFTHFLPLYTSPSHLRLATCASHSLKEHASGRPVAI